MRTCSAISRPTRSCASAVEAPRCGVSTTFGAPRSGLSAAIGSALYTSTAAPARCPECEGVRERGLVDDAAARDVEDERAGLRRLQLRAAEEPAGLRCQRGMHGDDVRPMQELGQPDQPRAGLGRLLLGQVRIAGDDPHLEADGATRDRLADLPEPDDAEDLSAQLRAGVARRAPTPRP